MDKKTNIDLGNPAVERVVMHYIRNCSVESTILHPPVADQVDYYHTSMHKATARLGYSITRKIPRALNSVEV